MQTARPWVIVVDEKSLGFIISGFFMSISFSCSGCGTRYSVKDDFAGKKTRCKKCSSTISIPESDGLADLAALDAPSIAPPPVPSQSVYKAPVTTYQPNVYQPSQPAAAKSGGGGLGTLSIPDGLNTKVALLLLLALAAATIYVYYSLGSFLNRVMVPEPLHGRVWFFIILVTLLSLGQHLLLIGMSAWLCVKAAASFAKSSTAEPSYVLATGAVACPAIAVTFAVGGLIGSAASGSRSGAMDSVVLLVIGTLVGLVLAAVLIQALLQLDWKTTLIAWAILIFAMPVTLFLVGRYVTPHAVMLAQSMAGFDRASVEQWVRDNPEELRSWRAEKEAEARAKQQEAQAAAEATRKQQQQAEEAERQADPLYGKTVQIDADLKRLSAGMHNAFREEVEPVATKLLAEVAAMKPLQPSKLWDALDAEAKKLAAEAASKPKRELPQWIFAEPDVPQTKVVPFADSELSASYNAFGWSVRVPKAFKIDLDGFDKRDAELRFKNKPDRGDAIVISRIRNVNPEQKQVYFYTESRFRALAEQQSILAFNKPQPRPTALRLGDLVFFEVPVKVNNGWTETNAYYIRDAKGWLRIVLEPDTFTRDASTLPAVVNLLPSMSQAGGDAIDPYAPEEIAQRVEEDARRSIAILKQQGEATLPVLRQIYATSTGGGKTFARDAIREITGEDPSGPTEGGQPPATPGLPAKPVSITDALAKVDAAAHVFAKRDAIRGLASATFDESMRDKVAQRLEQMMLAEDGYQYGEELAAAMQVWNRPQTATVLMPLITNERVHVWLRKPVIKAMAATKEKKAVLPVLRWIIKEPETVVVAAIGMGEAVEDETIKLLSERDANVRKNAARILMQVGTRKSMGPLLRAAKDARDPSAAALAQSAYDQVKDRVAATTTATTKPAN